MSFEFTIHIPGLDRLGAAVERYVNRILPVNRIQGAKIVYVVKDDQAPVNFALSVAGATDAKGQPVDPTTLKYIVSSSDEAIATVGPNSAAPDDDTQGTLTFLGEEGPVTINVEVEDSAGGGVIGAYAANFTVTAGLPTAITGGSITFAGLTEVPPVPAPPAPAA